MSANKIVGEYIDCIDHIILYCKDNDLIEIQAIRHRILELLDKCDVTEKDMVARSRDMNILYPREYSLLYRVVSAFNFHLFILSNVKSTKNIKSELIQELSIAWDLCNEIEEFFHA